MYISLDDGRGYMKVRESAVKAVSVKGWGIFATDGTHIVLLDDDATNALSDIEGDMKISISKAKDRDMTEAQKKAIGANYAVLVTLSKGATEIHELQGSADIEVVLENKKIDVCFVADDGTMEKIDFTYEDDVVAFTVNHFSIYKMTEGETVPSDDDDDEFPTLWVVLIVIGVALVIAAVIILARRARA